MITYEKFTENDRLAVLILAHKNVRQLQRLIMALRHDKIDIFIHIDKKWEVSINEIMSIFDDTDNIFFCNNRISANLDTWSLIVATFELIKKTKQIEHRRQITYKYTALLSGQDYPIKNLDLILNCLEKSYPKPFIDCTPYDRENWLYYKFNHLPSEIKIMQLINSNMERGLPRKIVKLPFYVFYKVAGKFHTIYDDMMNNGCKLYGGSAWWILPDIAINDFIREYDDTSNKCIALLKNTMTPEETLFQILIMRSRIANIVDINPKDMIAQNCKTYAYFSGEGKLFKGHPYVFTADDYEKIVKLPHFFARKFDQEIDSKILDLLDKKILNIGR